MLFALLRMQRTSNTDTVLWQAEQAQQYIKCEVPDEVMHMHLGSFQIT